MNGIIASRAQKREYIQRFLKFLEDDMGWALYNEGRFMVSNMVIDRAINKFLEREEKK